VIIRPLPPTPYRTNELELAQDFIEFLVTELGYPRDALLRDYPIPTDSSRHRARLDLLIVDPAIAKFLAVVEFKIHQTRTSQEDAFIQVKRYLEAINQPIPAFLVMNSIESPVGYAIFAFTDGTEWKEIPRHEFPLFSALRSGAIANQKNTISDQRQRRFDELKVICYVGAGVLLVLFVLSACKVFVPTPAELSLIAAIVGLLILPNATKLKGLGIEFERITKHDDKA